jgi:hypothetical protein
MDDLLDDLGSGGVGAVSGPLGAVAQAVDSFGFVAA